MSLHIMYLELYSALLFICLASLNTHKNLKRQILLVFPVYSHFTDEEGWDLDQVASSWSQSQQMQSQDWLRSQLQT